MRSILCTSALLSLVLIACGEPADTGLDGDPVDSGEVGDTGTEAADCSFVSIEPLVVSWNGGEDVTVTMECANPTTAGLTLILDDGAGTMSDVEASTSDSTLTATFTTAAVGSTGPRGFSLEVDGEAVDGDVLRFRLDPAELGQGLEVDAGPISHPFNLERAHFSRWKGRSMVVGVSTGGSLVVGGFDADNSWEAVALDGPTVQAGPATMVETETAQAVMLPLIDTEAGEFQMLMTVDNGKKRRTEFIVLDFDAMAVGGSTDVVSTSFTLDADGELAGCDVILLGDSSKTGEEGTFLTSASYDGKVWTRNWQYGVSRVVHVSTQATLSNGTTAVLVISEGAESLEASWISPVSGKTLSTQALKTMTGTPLAISSTQVVQEKGDDVAVAILDEDGGLFLLRAITDTSQEMTVQELDIETAEIARKIKASTNFRTLKPGQKLYFPPIQARGTADGDLHIALSYPLAYGSSEEGMLLASWQAGDSTVDLSATPDALELLSTGGRAYLSGSPGSTLSESPVVFQHAGAHITELGTVTGDSAAELVLAADGGWTVLSREGEVVVTNPDGKELKNLPISSYAQPQVHRVGDLCMLSGMLRVKNKDGSYATQPGVLTIQDEGVGIATFDNTALTDCAWDRKEDDTVTGMCFGGSGDGSFIGMAEFQTFELPAAGVESTITPATASWSDTWSASPVGAPAVFVDRIAVGDEIAADTDVTTLASLSGAPVTQDLVAVLPYDGDLACPVATYFVPGASTDWGKNLAAAVLLSSSDKEDCSDLALPEAALDLSGEGQSTVLMSQPSTTEGGRDLFELVWDGESLLALPTITVPEYTAIEVADFDGDGLEEVLVQLGAEPDEDGTSTDPLSGLMFRGIGLKGLSQEIRAEVIMIKNGDILPPPDDDDTVIGAAYELTDGSVDVVVVGGTAGRKVRKGNFSTVGVASQPPPVILSSWGAVLD